MEPDVSQEDVSDLNHNDGLEELIITDITGQHPVPTIDDVSLPATGSPSTPTSSTPARAAAATSPTALITDVVTGLTAFQRDQSQV